MKKSKEEKVVKTSLNSTLLFSDDKKKRFRLHIEWDKDKPVATVIMLSPSKATGILFDKTTNNVLSNLSRLDYGSVYIVNLFAELQENVRFSSFDFVLWYSLSCHIYQSNPFRLNFQTGYRFFLLRKKAS